MAHQDQAKQNYPKQSSAPLVLGSIAVVMTAYFGFVRPAQLHMQSLERQCNKLVIAVKKLQSKDDTARHGLRLISLLDAQSEKLDNAERIVGKFASLNSRLVRAADELAKTTAALQLVEQVRTDVDRHGRTLAAAANKLDDMSEISESITASSDIAREANGSLVTMSQLQSELSGSVAHLSQQLAGLERQLDARSESLPHAEQALAQIEVLCENLMEQTESISIAQEQLGQLVGLKREVLEQSTNLPAATAALDQMWDLQDGLLQAKQTLDKAQQLAVDMMLLEPVLDRVAKSLQPAAEATRLSKRESAKTPKTRQSMTSAAVTPWSSALNVFVALLNPAN